MHTKQTPWSCRNTHNVCRTSSYWSLSLLDVVLPSWCGHARSRRLWPHHEGCGFHLTLMSVMSPIRCLTKNQERSHLYTYLNIQLSTNMYMLASSSISASLAEANSVWHSLWQRVTFPVTACDSPCDSVWQSLWQRVTVSVTACDSPCGSVWQSLWQRVTVPVTACDSPCDSVWQSLWQRVTVPVTACESPCDSLWQSLWQPVTVPVTACDRRAATCNLPVIPHPGLPSTSRSQPPTPRAPSSPMSSSPTGGYCQLSCNMLPLCRPPPYAPFPSRPTAAHCPCLAFPPALWTHSLHERCSTPSVRSMPHSPPANAPPPQPPRVLLVVHLLPTSTCTEQLLPARPWIHGSAGWVAACDVDSCLFLTLLTMEGLTCCCAQCVLCLSFWARCFLHMELLRCLCPPGCWSLRWA